MQFNINCYMPGRTVVSADCVGNTTVDADITHIQEPIKCDACRAFIMRGVTSRAELERTSIVVVVVVIVVVIYRWLR